MNRKEALTYKVKEEALTSENGIGYREFTANEETHKLFHELSNKRLDEETQFEFQVRRFYVKEYTQKRGKFIWFSANNEAITNYKLHNMALKLKAERNANEDDLKEALMNMKYAEELGLKTNMGTFNKKEIEAFAKQQAVKTNDDFNPEDISEDKIKEAFDAIEKDQEE
jgi:flagellar hook-associated protein FlgK